MAKLKIYFKNDKDEYLKALLPSVTWTPDMSDALVSESEIADVDYAFLKPAVFAVIEKLFLAGLSLITIIITDEKDEECYKIDISTSDVKGYVNKSATLDTEFKDCMYYIMEELCNEVPDIVLRTKASPVSKMLEKTVESMKTAMGMKRPSLSGTKDIDKLIEEINENTKAEIVKPKETLKDYVCNNVLKEELEEIVNFFTNSQKYKDANIDIPKGILLKGLPGTGKTYAARCIAGTVDCYFMTCTASAIQGMYIGSGSENIRNIFKGAKALCDASKKGVILFIDEIDSFGDRQNRGGSSSGEEDRTLNQLLAELSGMEDTKDILVLAATNYPERLDDALQRSGRFGRQITIDYPDKEECEALTKFYFDKINMPKECDSFEISPLLKGLSPADIKDVANEAGILAIRNSDTRISIEYINEAVNKVITKNIRHPDIIETLDLVTAHECGHVLTEAMYCKTVPIKVTNYAYGDAGGFTQSDEVLSGILKKEDYIAKIKTLLGGRIAEQIICGYITSGASNDLKKAKAILTNYYKYFNFEKYEVSKLEQVVLDRLNEIYEETIEDIKSNPKALEALDILIKELHSKRVLYQKDMAPILLDLTGGRFIC